MPHPNFVILYVADPRASAAFYAELLEQPPVDASPSFAMFALNSGVMLGLWARPGVEPVASLTGGGGELAFSVASDADVDAWHKRWSGKGLTITLKPKRMDFGYTFVAVDPDGHRLRVFAPGMN